MIPEFDTRIIQLLDSMQALGHPVLTSNGIPFEWDEHVFLLKPLCDFHPSQGINKCAQVGFSETNIIKALYVAEHMKMNILYTLPTDSFVRDFVPPKVDKIISSNPLLFANVTGQMYQKEVGNGPSTRFIYFKGAHNPKSEDKREETSKGVSISSDLNIHDEASKSDPFILSQMTSRLANSKYGGRWLFDNPTYPKMGADAIYQKSDQRHWFVKCTHCSHRQYLDWIRLDQFELKKSHHSYVDIETKQIICSGCGKPIDNETRMDGEWVSKYPEKTAHRGYWINQLMYVHHTVEKLAEIESDPRLPTAYFQNMVMGKPYIGTDVKVERHHLFNNVNLEVNTLQNNVIGVDQGKIKWWVAGNEQGIFACGKTESWDDIERLMKKYDATVVTDGLPEQQKPKELARKYKGKVWRAFYKPHADQSELVKFVPEQDYMVLIRRNEQFDEIVDKIMTNRFPLQMNLNDVPEFVDHWTSMVRLVQEDKEGNQRFEWIETDADHFAHATLYQQVALHKARAGHVVSVKRPKQRDDKLPIVVSSEGGALSEDIIKSFTRNIK